MFDNALKKRLSKYRLLYLLLLPSIALIMIFCYVPMYGIIICFKDYKIASGILGSKWVGFSYFIKVFSTKSFLNVIGNTVIISIYRLIFGFPVPIILALLFNEIQSRKYKKMVQTVSYFPSFLSWVVLGSIFIEILSPQRGIINLIIVLLGGQAIHFLAEPSWFRFILIATGIWVGAGWNTVIYMATISGINEELYESALMDGANRFQRNIYITVPHLIAVSFILLILSLGGILNAGFDQIFNLYNPAVYNVADIIDTYVYRRGLVDANYSFATVVSLFKNVIGFILVVSTNMICKKVSNYSLW